jgi:hypothetical protein
MTLHLLDELKTSFLVNLQLKPDPNGDITLLRTFGFANAYHYDDSDNPMVRNFNYVDPLLIHAELNLIHDGRVKTVAQRLFEKYIAPRSDV